MIVILERSCLDVNIKKNRDAYEVCQSVLLLTVLFLKVRNEAKEPLWPRGKAGGQTASGSLVRMSSLMFEEH